MEYPKDFVLEKTIYSECISRGFPGTTVKLGVLRNKGTIGKNIRKNMVAIKETQRDNYSHEAKILAMLDHPNIIKCISFTDFYIILEGVKGVTLKKYCSTNKAFELSECVSLWTQLARGIQHIHDNNIIHHDLKAKNILIEISSENIGSGNILKICDFDISVIGKYGKVDTGSRECFAPEQYSSSSVITNKIDVYAYGVLFNAIMLNGRSSEQAIYCLPEKLTDIVKGCLDKNPETRFSINKVVDILDKKDFGYSLTYLMKLELENLLTSIEEHKRKYGTFMNLSF